MRAAGLVSDEGVVLRGGAQAGFNSRPSTEEERHEDQIQRETIRRRIKLRGEGYREERRFSVGSSGETVVERRLASGGEADAMLR